jgi:acetoin utilization deacetylase AcuC-like enzyme
MESKNYISDSALEKSLLEGMNKLNLKEEKIGFVFDERMLAHKEYAMKHVEKPERAMSIYMNLVFKGLTEKLVRVPSEEISEEDVLRVHTKSHFENVEKLQYEEEAKKSPKKNKKEKETVNTQNTQNNTIPETEGSQIQIQSPPPKIARSKLDNKTTFVWDTYDNYATFDSARVSAGSLLSICKAYLAKKIDHGFAIIRPPGHHAGSSCCRGFCFFNNVGIAAHFLKEKGLKVAVVDWDVHHGDGTQELFYSENNPLQISLHRHDNGLFYPNISGKPSELGDKDGLGYNLNIAWNTNPLSMSHTKASIGDDEYFYAFEKIVIPVLREYRPDVILVSCGFDAAENDPLGQMALSPIGYAYMTNQLKNIANCLIALEGGYNLDSLARCSETIIRTLLGEDCGFKGLLLQKEINELNLKLLDLNESLFRPSNYAIDQINDYKNIFSNYWSCLKSENTKSIVPKREFLCKDDQESLSSLKETLVLETDLFFKNNEVEMITQDERAYEFIKFKIGKLTFPNERRKEEMSKYRRKTRQDNRSLSRKLNFRMEGISLNKTSNKHSHSEKKFHWVSREGIFDTLEKDVTNYLSKFLEKANLKKSDLLEKLDKLVESFEKNSQGVDLYGVDLVILLDSSDDCSNEVGVKTRSSCKKVKKRNFFIKLNNIKEYSINKYATSNFLEGLKSLVTYIDENLIE